VLELGEAVVLASLIALVALLAVPLAHAKKSATLSQVSKVYVQSFVSSAGSLGSLSQIFIRRFPPALQ